MSIVTDIRRMNGLPDADVSSKFKSLVDGYVRDLAKSKNSKGNPGTGSVPSVRVGRIKRKKGQLTPSEILFAMRQAIWKAGWAQGVLRDSEGRMCLRGALVYLNIKGYTHMDDLQIAAQYLHDEVRRKNGDAQKYNFIYWNNDPKRTLADVLKILEDCGSRARLAGE
jgi:hypothetical protein